MPDVMADRRDSPRYTLIFIAEVTDIKTGTKTSARTSDVSQTGCYVDTLRPPSIGTRIHLRITRAEDTFQTGGRVVYVGPGLGMGVRFREQVTDAQLAILDRLLGEAARNP